MVIVSHSILTEPSVLECTDDTFTQGAIGLYASHSQAQFDGVLVQNGVPVAPHINEIKVGDGKLTLNFNEIGGAIQYKVEYGTESGNYTNAFYTSSTTPEITGLQNGTRYYVVVSAQTLQGWGERSTEVSEIPSVPTAVTPTLNTVIANGNEVIVNFTTDPINTSYIIRYGTAPGSYTNEIRNVENTGYKLTIPFSHIPYYFVVIGENEKGESLPSNEVSCAANSNILYQDDFEDGTYEETWEINAGSVVEGNGVFMTNGADPDRFWVKQMAQISDYVVSADFELPKDQNEVEVEVMGRVGSQNDYYVAGYYRTEDGSEYATFRKKINESFVGGYMNEPFTLDKTRNRHTLQAFFEGDKITLYIDGSKAYERTESDLKTGMAGLFAVRTKTVFR